MTFKVPANLRSFHDDSDRGSSWTQPFMAPELPIPEPHILCPEPEQASHLTTPLHPSRLHPSLCPPGRQDLAGVSEPQLIQGAVYALPASFLEGMKLYWLPACSRSVKFSL